MKPTELRIGNIVRYNDELCKVFLLAKNEIYTEVLDEGTLPFYKMEYVKPEPLSEEWLKKIGFFRHDKKYRYIVFEDLYYDIKKVVGSYSLCRKSIKIANIRYLHQLQNIHFALTGEELL